MCILCAAPAVLLLTVALCFASSAGRRGSQRPLPARHAHGRLEAYQGKANPNAKIQKSPNGDHAMRVPESTSACSKTTTAVQSAGVSCCPCRFPPAIPLALSMFIMYQLVGLRFLLLTTITVRVMVQCRFMWLTFQTPFVICSSLLML